jgi:mRNA interferase MazF
MVVERGEIWWANLPEPIGSNPGFRRPVLIIQSNQFNQSRINTVIVAIISSNTKLVGSLGNVLITSKQTGLSKDSVVNVTQLYTMDESLLIDFVSSLSERKMEQVDEGLRLVLSLPKI